MPQRVLQLNPMLKLPTQQILTHARAPSISESSLVCFSVTSFPSLFVCTSSLPPSSAGFFQIFRSFYPFHGCLRKVIRENTSFDTAVADVWCGKSNLLWQSPHRTKTTFRAPKHAHMAHLSFFFF